MHKVSYLSLIHILDWSGSQCNLYVNLEDNGTQVMDFQDKYALLDMMYDEANEYYKDNK